MHFHKAEIYQKSKFRAFSIVKMAVFVAMNLLRLISRKIKVAEKYWQLTHVKSNLNRTLWHTVEINGTCLSLRFFMWNQR